MEPSSDISNAANVRIPTAMSLNSSCNVLYKILEPCEFELLPSAVVTKIEEYIDHRFQDFLTIQALNDNSQRNCSKFFHA